MADQVNFKFEGIDELLRKFDTYSQEKQEGIKKAIWNVAGQVHFEARENCERKFTGTPSWAPEPGTPTRRLQGSLTMASTWGKRKSATAPATEKDAIGNPVGAGPSVVVGTNIKYALYPELGTKRMAARPYLYPALFARGGNLEAALKKVFEKVEGEGAEEKD